MDKESLAPIRLDIEIDGYRIKDTFTWNVNEVAVTPEAFADVLCHDFDIPKHLFKQPIVSSIKEQLADYCAYGIAHADECQDLRVPIKLDIIVGNIMLNDQFEWDLNCPTNNAEEFAASLVAELGLSTEFISAIAHSIREQCFLYRKSFLVAGSSFDGQEIRVNDYELSQVLLPKLTSAIREDKFMDSFTPLVQYLADADLEKLELNREREARRKRRHTRGGKKEAWIINSPPKTNRTALTYKGSLHRNTKVDEDDESVRMTRSQAAIKTPAKKIKMRLNHQFSQFASSPQPSRQSNGEWKCFGCGVLGLGFPAATRDAHNFCKNCFHLASAKAAPLPDPVIKPPSSIPMSQRELIPSWLWAAKSNLDENYPHDLFDFVVIEGEIKIKCLECVAKIFGVGPYKTLNNFEAHLKQRSHRANVEQRVNKR